MNSLICLMVLSVTLFSWKVAVLPVVSCGVIFILQNRRFFYFRFFSSCVLNLAALRVWLKPIEIESWLTCPFPLSGFYPCCDLVPGVFFYPYSSVFWLLFKVHVMRTPCWFNYLFDFKLLGLARSSLQKHLVAKKYRLTNIFLQFSCT